MNPLGADRANPAVYVDLEAHRGHIREMYGRVLWGVIESMRSPHLDELGQGVAADLFDRVADEALWAVTEIRPHDELKYFSQRYVSEDVRTRWANLAAANVKHKHRYFLGPDRRVEIKHEHVVPRKRLKKALADADCITSVAHVLERPVACIVSVKEDQRLPKGGRGWERYIDRVRVFDRFTQDWADLHALATTQA